MILKFINKRSSRVIEKRHNVGIIPRRKEQVYLGSKTFLVIDVLYFYDANTVNVTIELI